MKIKHFLFAILIGFVFITACGDDEPTNSLVGTTWESNDNNDYNKVTIFFVTHTSGRFVETSIDSKGGIHIGETPITYNYPTPNVRIDAANHDVAAIFYWKGVISGNTMALNTYDINTDKPVNPKDFIFIKQ